jgi:flagellar L-ring protein FlgH
MKHPTRTALSDTCSINLKPDEFNKSVMNRRISNNEYRISKFMASLLRFDIPYFKYICLVVGVAAMAAAGIAKEAKVSDPTGLQEYVDSAKKAHNEAGSGKGSLWTDSGPRANLYGDMKARFVHDILTINVLETTQAASSAKNSSSRASSASAGLDSFMGLPKRIKELPNMVSGTGQSKFDGQGSTTRATTLATTLTARVTDVLPNGYLVVEGKREIRVNNENQTIVLTGVVRPEDISTNNVVLSSAVAQMSVRVQGKGSVSQPINPGWLYKILTKILPF